MDYLEPGLFDLNQFRLYWRRTNVNVNPMRVRKYLLARCFGGSLFLTTIGEIESQDATNGEFGYFSVIYFL